MQNQFSKFSVLLAMVPKMVVQPISEQLNAPQGSDIATCCGFFQPSQDLVNAFKVDANGLPLLDTYNTVDLKNDMNVSSDATFVPFTDVVDPRLDFTVSRRGILIWTGV